MKTKTIKPIFKSYKKQNTTKWILEQFPVNYQDMCYVEPYGGGINLLLQKDKSLTEAINDLDENLLKIYQCLRDEPKEFIKRLNHYKYCEDTFNKIKKKNSGEDYLEQSICEFILKKMSRSELKNSFSNANSLTWKQSVQQLYDLSDRLQEVFIFNKDALKIIDIFNFTNCFLYCDPPIIDKKSNEEELDKHNKLSQMLKKFKGKIIISGLNSSFYKKTYSNWNLVKESSKNTEVIWKNF